MSELEKAVSAWTKALAEDRVITSDKELETYVANVSGLERRVPTVLYPTSTDEVAKVVEIANEHRIPLYPISTGRNWGMGSKLPVKDDTVVVDLTKMNEVREVNQDLLYAVVEPGVTQQQLYEHLRDHDMPFMFDTTVSGKDTSIIGNTIECGLGYAAIRFDIVAGFEVVLGNGKVVKTGFTHFPDSRVAHASRYSVGPYIEGLFTESNFGIVTSMAIHLSPKHEACSVFTISIQDDDKLGDMIDALAELRRRGAIQNIIKVGNKERSRVSLCPLMYEKLVSNGAKPGKELREHVEQVFDENFGSWSALAGLWGSPGQIKEAQRLIKKRLNGLGKIRFLTESVISMAEKALSALNFIPKLRGLEAVVYTLRPFYELINGKPTDLALQGLYWLHSDVPDNYTEPDVTNAGMLCYLPILPLQGDLVAKFSTELLDIGNKHGFLPTITYNIVDSRTIWCVIDVLFDRSDPKRVQAGLDCIEEWYNTFNKQGLYVQRVGIQSMHQVVDPSDPFWQTVKDLKSVLDPNGIIAPERYCPEDE